VRISDIIKHISSLFERKRKNPIQLDTDSNLESNLKFLKVGDKSTPIQISEDTINVEGNLNVNGSAVQTGSGSTVSELNDLSDVTYSSGDLTITSLDTIVSGALTVDSSGDITLDAAGEQINIAKSGTTFASFDTATDGKMKFIGGTDYNLEFSTQGTGDVNLSSTDDINIDAADALSIDTDGSFAMKQDGTEYSVANSAYAGMILAYRMIGEDATHAQYALTTSFSVPNSAMTVRFIAPPSGAVEVTVQIYANASTSNKSLYFGLSDNSTYNTIGATYEHLHRFPDETDDAMVQHMWTITGLTAGSTYNYWLGAKTSGTNFFLTWGGTASGRYGDFIMKVVALPAATSDFAEYD
tara:strand:- start:269 stop:1333 length:1065 start_codon:yes stop_codon:yes gene_type:complete